MRLLRRLGRRLREDRGVESLEMIVAAGVWWIAVLIFVNMFLLLGTAMTVNAGLNRAGQHTAAMGCLHSTTLHDLTHQLQRGGKYGLGADKFELIARTPASHDGTYLFNRNSVITGEGTASEKLHGHAANCEPSQAPSQRDQSTETSPGNFVVTNGEYIWLRVKYRQRLAFLPGVDTSVTMRRSMLVISQSLRSDPPGA